MLENARVKAGVYETATPYQADNYQRQSRLNVVKPTKSYGLMAY